LQWSSQKEHAARLLTGDVTDAATFVNHGATARHGRDGRSEDEPLVLIVDDYPDCREMYAMYLALAGFRVLKARDGFEALELAREAVPDLILMDLGLPGIDGCEVTRRLKQDRNTRQVPVVALTAQAPLTPDALSMAGFESLITKPCLPDELAEHVHRLVRRHTRPPS
jgi:CheY-like chemotaxis protein